VVVDEGFKFGLEGAEFRGVVGGIPGIVDLPSLGPLVLLSPDFVVNLIFDGFLLGREFGIALGVIGADGIRCL